MSVPSFCPTGGGLKQNYLSIDDIIMSSERVHSTFKAPVPGLGFLDPNSRKKDIVVGTKVDLPLWLAASLGQPTKKIVTIEYTKPYKATYREILKADADVVDLHKLGPYYYAFGQQLLALDHLEAIPLSKTLLLTFVARFRRIMDLSGNSFDCDDTSLKIKRLDEMELKLFQLGQSSVNSFRKWSLGKSRKLEVSETVSRHRKRKHDEIN